MKRIVLITALFLFSTTSAFALNNIYIDALGNYVNTKDASRQLGGGYSIGYNIIDNVNIIHRFTYTAGSKKTYVPVPDTTYTDNYEYMFVSIGADYTWFFWNRFGVRAGTLFGIAPLDVEAGYSGIGKNHDSTVGFGVVFLAGFHATISQNIAFFVDIGFQYTYYAKAIMSDSFDSYGDGATSYSSKPSVFGETIYIGLRFTIGKNNRMSDGY